MHEPYERKALAHALVQEAMALVGRHGMLRGGLWLVLEARELLPEVTGNEVPVPRPIPSRELRAVRGLLEAMQEKARAAGLLQAVEDLARIRAHLLLETGENHPRCVS